MMDNRHVVYLWEVALSGELLVHPLGYSEIPAPVLVCLRQ